MATINISLPKAMQTDVRNYIADNRYTSVSEFIRDAIRKVLYPGLTENGFTQEFEEAVLRSEASPEDQDITLDSPEDIDNYFRNLVLPKKKKQHGQSKI